MKSDVTVALPSDLLLRGPEPERVAVALLAPLSGIMGVAGPSIVNCAVLAAEDVSAATGRSIELVLIDAGRDAVTVAAEVDSLIRAGLVAGLSGTHPSDIREAVDRVARGRVPYVFTPPHEYRRSHHASFYLGVGPLEQLRRPIAWLGRHRHVRRWALIGNDYVWPRQMHHAAATILSELKHEVVLDRLVPLGAVDTERLVAEAEHARADALLVSLIGRDSIVFQREVDAVASRPLVRLFTAFDENSLVAAGGDATGDVFAAMPSFVLQNDDRHHRLMEHYAARFGLLAPVPGAYAEGTYEGMHVLATLCTSGMLAGGAETTNEGRTLLESVRQRSPQLAIADGNELRVVERLAEV
ncbi:ABC transporter substrate-binding protein [Leifsonia sp. NPDC058248]|uniref:ABC transporter substrate-binding protein n=1 Tax=Leifsonia sp. NPDC058248 TaxID=3346402 RepID=UPI0036D8AB1B